MTAAVYAVLLPGSPRCERWLEAFGGRTAVRVLPRRERRGERSIVLAVLGQFGRGEVLRLAALQAEALGCGLAEALEELELRGGVPIAVDDDLDLVEGYRGPDPETMEVLL